MSREFAKAIGRHSRFVLVIGRFAYYAGRHAEVTGNQRIEGSSRLPEDRIQHPASGGHIIMGRGVERLIIPRHRKIEAMTMGDIARKAGLTPDEFRRLL